MPGVARGICLNEILKIPGVFSKKFRFLKKKSIFLAFVTPGAPMGSLKKFSPFGPAVWPAIGNIYTNVLFIECSRKKRQMIKFLTFYKFKKMISLLDISSVWGVRYDTSGLHRSSYEKGSS